MPRHVRGDPGRLRQILTNLANNAIKFTEKGEVLIEVTARPVSGSKVRLQIEVHDTGIGIPSDQLDNLFKPFSQVDASSTRLYGGTGLGLSICKSLVEMMRGEIGVRSQFGQGSTFWFSIEIIKHPSSAADQMLLPARARGRRILVVDDNATNRRILRGQLQNWKLKVEEAQDGPEALAMMRQEAVEGHKFCAAIVDMKMPGMDGATLAQEMRADENLKGIPLMLLSSMDTRPMAGRLLGELFDIVLTKPVRSRMLYQALLTLCVHTPGLLSHDSEVEVTLKAEVEPVRQLRILLAEDNPINQKVARRLLERIGYNTVEVATTGQEVLQLWQQETFDVILMDVQMPEMDGLEATDFIRRREAETGSRVTIIAMTAHAMKGDLDRFLAAGMDDYVPKPIQPADLEAALGRVAVELDRDGG